MRVCTVCAKTTESGVWRCRHCGKEPEKEDGIIRLGEDFSELHFPEEEFRKMAAMEKTHFWNVNRRKLILEMWKRHAPGMEKYLELGSGTGFVLRGMAKEFPRAKLAVADHTVSGIRHLVPEFPEADFFQMDATRIPFRDTFDAVGLYDVLEHIVDDRGALREIAKAMRQSGTLMITVPQHQWLWSPHDEMLSHVRRYSRKDLLEKAREAGFSVCRATSFVSLLLPAMFAARFLARKGNAKTAEKIASTATEMPGLLNRPLGWAMTVERALIKAGIGFPFGGSLLAVLRKN